MFALFIWKWTAAQEEGEETSEKNERAGEMHQFKRTRKLQAQPGAERNACLCFRKEVDL